MFKHTTIAKMEAIAGSDFPHYVIDAELERLGGGNWEGLGFRNQVLKAVGLDVDARGPIETQVAVYNKIADALNSISPPVTKDKLCAVLGI
jgi:hypothetical protein